MLLGEVPEVQDMGPGDQDTRGPRQSVVRAVRAYAGIPRPDEYEAKRPP